MPERYRNMEYAVFSRRILTGTISDLPPSARLAWIAILFEAEKLRGKVKLPVRDLAKMASITTPEAAEALRLFQEPDPYSSTSALDGKRLIPVEDEEDWYIVVTWEKHVEERAAFFNRLRQQRYRSKNVTQSNAPLRSVTKEPEPDLEPREKNQESKAKSTSSAQSAPPKTSAKELVESFILGDDHRIWAAQHCPSVPIEKELEAWRDRCRENKYRTKTGPIADPAASWRKAMRNAEEWGTYVSKRPAGNGGNGRGDHREIGRKDSGDPPKPLRDFGHRNALELLAELERDGKV